jgi:hypothetical protein
MQQGEKGPVDSTAPALQCKCVIQNERSSGEPWAEHDRLMADTRLVIIEDSVAEKSQTPRCEMLIDKRTVT